MPLYLSGAPLICFVSHLNVTTDMAGGAGLFMLIIGADDVECEPLVDSVKLVVCIPVRKSFVKILQRNATTREWQIIYLADGRC